VRIILERRCKMSCVEERVTQRVHYFEGQILGVSDFEAEQAYRLDRDRAHNRLHGTGVVCGLDVLPTDPPSAGVIVTPGVAIDATGREIVVGAPVEVDLGPSRRRPLFVTVSYDERLEEPVPTPDGARPSRVREIARLAVTEVPASDDVVLASLDAGGPGGISADAVHTRRRISAGCAVEAAALKHKVDALSIAVAGLGVVAGWALLRRC
jgi:hypothetical protein